MKLDSHDRQRDMFHGHGNPLERRGHLEFRRCHAALKGVVPGSLKGRGDPSEEIVPLVDLNRRGFAVHRVLRANGGAAEKLVHTLHPQADAQNGLFLVKNADDRVGKARFPGSLRARRDHIGVIPPSSELILRPGVIPDHLDRPPESALEKMKEDIGERVIIIDKKDFLHTPPLHSKRANPFFS